MSLSSVLTQVFTNLESAVGLPAVRYPNVSYGVQTDNHLRVSILPADTDDITFDSAMEQGIIQVSVYVDHGVGAIVPANIAQQILDLFPRNLNLSGVRINKTGTVAPPLKDNGWFVLPVSIPYQLIS